MDEVLESLGDILKREFVFPPDILNTIKADDQSWKNYQNFSDVCKRIRVAFIEAARKRPEEFQKRLNYSIKMTYKNKFYGFGDIEKYY